MEEDVGCDLTNALYKTVKEYHSKETFPEFNQHHDLLPTLRPYQNKAVQWMLSLEKTHERVTNIAADKETKVVLPHGGILADEMGMGKTLEVLACVLANPLTDIEKQREAWTKSMSHVKKASECFCTEDKSTRLTSTASNDVSTIGDLTFVSSSRMRTSMSSSLDHTYSDSKHVYSDDDEDYVVKKRKRKRKNKKVNFDEDDLSCKESVKRKKRKKNYDESDDLTFENVKITPAKPQQSETRRLLDLWYQAKLLETTPSFRAEKKRAMKVQYELRCCCSDDTLASLASKEDSLRRIQCSLCCTYQHSSCVGTEEGDYDLDNPYMCFQCWPKQLVPSKGTIIISPASISGQWMTEIDKHIRKPGLNVLVYDGVRGSGYIQPTMLAEYDIVITTYQVLNKELDYIGDSNSRSLRYTKKFLAPTSPLISVNWWRLCLDEAQMVECITSKVAEMVNKIKAINKWAVCGTPIQRSVQDLYGLLCFLQVQPYCVYQRWRSLVANKVALHEFIPHVMWRMCKMDVLDELGVPPQTVIIHRLKFSPVEMHFYKKQHAECTKMFMEKLSSLDSLDVRLDKMDRKKVSQILAPLLRLRQACIHPQAVKGQFLTIKKTMTMSELLSSLVSKAVTESEEALRVVIAGLNGIAALYLIMGNQTDAIDYYRQVLLLIQDYDGRLKVDSLQQIHTLWNLAEALQMIGPELAGIPRTLRDDTLKQDAAKLEEEYMIKRKGDMEATKQTLKEMEDTIKKLEESKDKFNWWLSTLEWLPDPKEFINRMKIDVVNSRYNIEEILLSKVNGRYGLIQRLRQWKEKIDTNRKKVIESLSMLQKTPMESLASAAVLCHLKLNKRKKPASSNKCSLCKCEQYLLTYETVLFLVKDRSRDGGDEGEEEDEENDFEDPTPGTSTAKDNSTNKGSTKLIENLKNYTQFEVKSTGVWKPSLEEHSLKMLMTYARQKHCNRAWLEDAQIHLKYLYTIKKEFKSLRHFWTQMFDHVAACDELGMAKLRLRLPYPGETIELKKSKEEKSIHIIAPHQVEVEFARLMSEKALAMSDLRKKSGTLQYLQNLQKSKEEQNVQCPVCRNNLHSKWSVLCCGHCYCFDCIPVMLNMAKGSSIVCAVCREQTEANDVAYIEGDREVDSDSEPVQGSQTTKIAAVVSTLLKLRKSDTNVKVLIFSFWEKVLNLICEALTCNNITFRRLAASPKQRNAALTEFKNDQGVTALVLPVKHGARGLNLIEATHVFLVEPQMNPADELQAVGRVHRIGQTRETFVHRFIVKNTIEEQMLSAIEGSTELWSKYKITVRMLKNLFSSSESSVVDSNSASVITIN